MSLSPRKQLLLAIAVIWIAAFIAFSNSFTIAFQFDDTHTVQSNVYIRSLSNIPLYFVDAKTYSYRPENSGYRPMSSLACALGFQLSHSQTWGYHLIKLLEHCLVATFIMLLGLRLLPKTGVVARTPEARFLSAFFAGLIFAVHRVNTETVDYITAISSLQAGMFFIIAFYLYLRFREPDGARRRFVSFGFLGLSVLCYLSGMLSKEEAITLPAMLVLYEWVYARKKGEGFFERLRANFWTWTKLVFPYVCAAALFVTLRTLIQPAVADTSRGNIDHWVYFITQFRSWFHYWFLFFWPVTLNSDNLSFEFSQSLADPRALSALSFHCAVWAVAWKFGRTRRFVLFAVAWLYVTVLPASSFFPLVEAVNEHRAYIPYMFLSLLAVWLFFSACLLVSKAGRNLAIGLLSVIALALGAGAYARNEVWQTDVSLWEDVYAKNPDSQRALNVLGITRLNRGEYEAGLPLLERCHKIAPTYLPCMVHLSVGYAHFRRYEEGLALLKYAHSLDPNYAHVNYHLGLYHKDYLGLYREAMPYFTRVHEVTSGRFFQATLKLAEIYLDDGDFKQAMALANAVLKIDLANGDAWDVLARAELLDGQLAPAKRILDALVQRAPETWRYVFDYANLAERQHDYKAAAALFERITTALPGAIQAWGGLARSAKASGDSTASAQAAAKVEELKKSGKWEFMTSLNLIGEKAHQIRP